MKILLDGTWSLRYHMETKAMPPVEEWPCIPAQVPGNAELDLWRAGIEPDPFFGDNLYAYRKYEYYSWEFSRSFAVDRLPEKDRMVLDLEGVNTFAEITINGIPVGQCGNMLIAHRFDVTDALHPGENEISVLIRSALNRARLEDRPVSVHAGDGNQDYILQRRPPSAAGWDIMGRFLSAGLWRSVWLESESATRLTQVYFATRGADAKRALVECRYRYTTDEDMLDGFRIRVTIGDVVAERPAIFTAGSLTLAIDAPRLWWPRGYGEAELYDVKTELLLNGETVAVHNDRIGIRTVEIDHKMLPGDEGEFLIRLNGVPILAKGSNWVPLDAMHSRDASRYERALQLFDETNCNILRCWGGNVYEDHAFYDLCDRLGILVWQDFTMACAIYPQDREFGEKIEREAVQVIRKLRNHPCILLWAGDNEVDESYIGVGYAPESNRYNALTREYLPRAVRENDPYRMYLPSSPYIDNGVARYLVPEQHNWGARAYFKDDFYKNTNAHFISECGYHGCPSPESLRKYIPEEKLWPIGGSEWTAHNTDYTPFGGRGYDRNELMQDQVRILFGSLPDDLDTFSKLSQIVQAEAKKFFIERTRIRKWRRTGIIWWNMLDGWPQISDAVVDYYFDKKRAFGYIRRVQEKTCVMLDELKDWGHTVILGNDSREDFDVSYRLTDGETGEVLLEGREHSPANENVELGEIRVLAGTQRLILIEWNQGDRILHNHYITGYPAFDPDTMLRWAGIIDRQQDN